MRIASGDLSNGIVEPSTSSWGASFDLDDRMARGDSSRFGNSDRVESE